MHLPYQQSHVRWGDKEMVEKLVIGYRHGGMAILKAICVTEIYNIPPLKPSNYINIIYSLFAL